MHATYSLEEIFSIIDPLVEMNHGCSEIVLDGGVIKLAMTSVKI